MCFTGLFMMYFIETKKQNGSKKKLDIPKYCIKISAKKAPNLPHRFVIVVSLATFKQSSIVLYVTNEINEKTDKNNHTKPRKVVCTSSLSIVDFNEPILLNN